MRLFDYNNDINQLNSWLMERNLPQINYRLPDIGFIQDDVACGFLCKTDSVACFLDPFFTNPKADSEKRNLALDLIIEEVEKKGKDLGFKRSLFITFEESFKDRGKRHGFLINNTFFGYKEL